MKIAISVESRSLGRVVGAGVVVLLVTLLHVGSVNARERSLGFLPADKAVLRLRDLSTGCIPDPMAVELYDSATVKPLVVLPDGSPEAFIGTKSCASDGPNKHLLFVGLYSGKRIEYADGIDSFEPWRGPPPGKPFSIKGEGRRAVVVDWCCNQYIEQFSPHRKDSERLRASMRDQLQLFSKDEVQSVFDLKPRQCLPLDEPTFILGPDGKSPAWVRLYAKKPPEPIEDTQCSADDTLLTYDGMQVGSVLREGLLLVRGWESRDLNLIDIRSGDFVLPLAPNERAPRLEEVLEFKRQFRGREKCPPIEEGLTARGNAINCQEVLKARYEKQLVEHFFR